MAIGPTMDHDLGTRQEATAHSFAYVNAAPVVDVIFDQLEYLMNHAAHGCPAECVDCARLERVKYWLLLPFRPISRAAD